MSTHGNTKHGHYKSITYSSWQSMKRRCVPSNKYYSKVVICREWVISFESFLKDMGERPSIEYSIDRIDNSKGYEKTNCRWATKREQALNRKNFYTKELSEKISKGVKSYYDSRSV